jgi:hypothetical protein
MSSKRDKKLSLESVYKTKVFETLMMALTLRP